MKKFILLATQVLCMSICISAQTLERNVISSFGISFTGSSIQADCTMGEVITFTGEGSENFLTQGFHQPIAIVSICQTPHEETINASACNSYELNGETYTTAGSYTQMLIAEDGCDSIIYINLQLNALSNELIAVDNTLTAAQDNATYAWTHCGEQTVLGSSQIFIPTQNGDYQVTITQEDCEVVSECVSFVVGVEEILHNIELNLFPNPTRDVLNVRVLGTGGNSSFTVYDCFGRVVMSRQMTNSTTQISIQEFAAGTYLIVVRTNQSVITKSFVKG